MSGMELFADLAQMNWLQELTHESETEVIGLLHLPKTTLAPQEVSSVNKKG